MATKESIKSSIPQIDRGALRRVLGVFDLFAVGYGDLGSSIYYALGVAAFFALGATPIAMLLAGLVFVCTSLSYAEMSSMFQESGGAASYTRHAFNDLISFISGWGLLLDYIVTIAISAFTVGPYLATFFPELRQPSVQILFAVILILALLVMNIFGVKQTTRTSFFLMVFTVLTQLVIILMGAFTAGDITKVFSHLAINKAGVDWSPSWGDFLKGTAMAMVAFTGIESIVQLGAETRQPSRTLPRAIIVTMFVLLFMYFGLSYVGFSVLSPYDLSHTYEQQPIAGIVQNLAWGGKVLLPWVGILAALTLFVAANAGLIGASRLSFNMGEYYQLPRIFYSTHRKFRTPYIALTFFAILACIVVAVSGAKLGFLADLYNFGAQIAFFSTQISLIVLRVQQPKLKRTFKVPFNLRIKGYEIPIPAIVGALASFSVWSLVVVTKPDGRLLGIIWLLIGVVMYVLYRQKKKISPVAQVTLQKIKIPKFEPLIVKKILLPLRSSMQTETVQFAIELAKLHKAQIVALHIIEVPFSMPLDTALPHRVTLAGAVLKTAEALALDQNVDIQLDIRRARSISEAVIDIAQKESFDLLILESMEVTQKASQKELGKIVREVLQNPPCRIWVCHAKPGQTARTSLAEAVGIDK